MANKLNVNIQTKTKIRFNGQEYTSPDELVIMLLIILQLVQH